MPRSTYDYLKTWRRTTIASMRPRRNAAEYKEEYVLSYVMEYGFNEAAA